MVPYTRRKILRSYQRNPIWFTLGESEEQHQGEIRDCSQRGLKFVSPMGLEPGDSIQIDRAHPNQTTPNKLTVIGSNAVVCWCREIPGAKGYPYVVGVTFHPKAEKKQLNPQLNGQRNNHNQNHERIP
jgi:hypothetical protein